jgi:quercetin dioxygenase-like cupin family protein
MAEENRSMGRYRMIAYTSRAALFGSLWCCLSVFVVAPDAVRAEASPKQRAVASAFDDAGLKWDACPPLFPKGCEIAVLRGDPAKPNVDIFYKVPPKYVIPHHWHTSAERMVLVAGELRVTYDGQDTVVLKPGMYAYGPAKAPHKGMCADTGPCVLFIAFEAPVDAHPTDPEAK